MLETAEKPPLPAAVKGAAEIAGLTAILRFAMLG